MERSDVISIHMFPPRTTHHLIKTEALALMKPTAFVNGSRAPIVQDVAVINARKIGTVVLYVLEDKLLPPSQELPKLDVLLSPHVQTAVSVLHFLDGREANTLGPDKGAVDRWLDFEENRDKY